MEQWGDCEISQIVPFNVMKIISVVVVFVIIIIIIMMIISPFSTLF